MTEPGLQVAKLLAPRPKRRRTIQRKSPRFPSGVRFVSLLFSRDPYNRIAIAKKDRQKGDRAVDIGKTIAELRNAGNMSQQTLAGLLFVSRDLVSKWETGRRRPDYATIEKIALIFGVSPDRIADRNDVVFKELSECVSGAGDLTGDSLVPLLEDFLEGLGKRDAQIFLRRYYFLEAPSDIAALFGIKENHVRSILSKTRRKLAKYVKERSK